MISRTFLLRVASDGWRAAAQWAGIASTPQGVVDPADVVEWNGILVQYGLHPFEGDSLQEPQPRAIQGFDA